MATELRFEHVVHCSGDLFWSSFFDDTYSQRLFCHELGFPSYRVVEHTEDAATVRRRLQVTPKVQVRVFGLGPMLERFAAKTIEDAYDSHARALNAQLASHA